MTSLAMFTSCENQNREENDPSISTQECLKVSLVPLMVVMSCVLLKVRVLHTNWMFRLFVCANNDSFYGFLFVCAS
jgi:hypothetical protein